MVGGKNQAEVDCAWMDGRNRAVLWRKCSLPGSLSFSSEGRVVYWADTGEQSAALPVGLTPFLLTFSFPSVEGVISSVRLDGSGYKQYKSGPGLLVSFTHTENVLVWATQQKGQDRSLIRCVSVVQTAGGDTHTHTVVTINKQPLISVEISACVTGLVFTLCLIQICF